MYQGLSFESGPPKSGGVPLHPWQGALKGILRKQFIVVGLYHSRMMGIRELDTQTTAYGCQWQVIVMNRVFGHENPRTDPSKYQKRPGGPLDCWTVLVTIRSQNSSNVQRLVWKVLSVGRGL